MAQQTFSGVPGDFTAGQVLTAADMDLLREWMLYLIKDGDEGDTGEVSNLILDLQNDQVDVTGRLHVAQTGNSNTPAVALIDNNAASVPPFMEVFATRSDSNTNNRFSARLMLTKQQTNADIVDGTSLGGIWFGGTPDHADADTRVYAAAITTRADGADWDTGAGNQPTEMRFMTGTTGIQPQDTGAPGSTAFYINAAGNCGMSTTTLSADAVLSLSGDSGGDYKLMFQEASADVISLKYVGSAGSGDANKFQIYDDLDDAALLTCDLAGRFAIGTTAPTFPLQVVSSGTTTAVAIHNSDSSANASNSQLNIQYTADGNCTGAYFIKFADSAGTIGSVTCASTSSVAFNTTSDYRTKENVTDLTGAVDLINALRPINYTFIRDPLSTPLQGFLAHEVDEVVPQAISGEKDALRIVPAEEGTRAVVSEPATYVQAEVTDENGDPVLDEAGNPTFVDTDEILTPAVMVKETFEISPAHEVEDHQQIDYGKLVPVLTGAIKELDTRLVALEAAT